MSSTHDLEAVCKTLEALRHEVKRVQDNIVINESRILDARSSMAGVDDDGARRAIAMAERAHSDLCNANYGFLNEFLTNVQNFIERIRTSR